MIKSIFDTLHSPQIDLESLLKTKEEMQAISLSGFNGIKIIVSLMLKGNQWFAMVSQELYDKIVEHGKEK